MIGILRWAIELGRIDIINKDSHLSSHNASPRACHLEAAFQVFEYLDAHNNGGRVIFDSTQVDVDESRFPDVNWNEIYGDIEEEIPPSMPSPQGNPVRISMFCDAVHAGKEILYHEDHILVSYSSLIMHQSIGIVRSKLQLRLQCLDLSLWRFELVSK